MSLDLFSLLAAWLCWLKRISSSCRIVTLNGSLIHPLIKLCLHPSHASLSRNLDLYLLPPWKLTWFLAISHTHMFEAMCFPQITVHILPPSPTSSFPLWLASIRTSGWLKKTRVASRCQQAFLWQPLKDDRRKWQGRLQEDSSLHCPLSLHVWWLPSGCTGICGGGVPVTKWTNLHGFPKDLGSSW